MSVQIQTKAVVSVAEMARMVGLSRARFYQLVNEGVFPPPLYRIDTKRPFFNARDAGGLPRSATAKLRDQRKAGAVLRSAIGNANRQSEGDTAKEFAQARRPDRGPAGARPDNCDAAQVEAAIQKCFPNGKSGVDDETVLRTVFLHLKRQNSSDNVGR